MATLPFPGLLNPADYDLVLSPGTYESVFLETMGPYADGTDPWDTHFATASDLANALGQHITALDGILVTVPDPQTAIDTSTAKRIAAELDASAADDGVLLAQFEPIVAPPPPTPPTPPVTPPPPPAGGSPPPPGDGGGTVVCYPYVDDYGNLQCSVTPIAPPKSGVK